MRRPSADEVADLEEPRKVMQRCIRVRAAQRFHESGENVIMVVTVAVIAHGAALSYRGGVLGGDDAALPRGGEEKLDRVYRLAHVPAAGGGDAFGSTVLERERSLPPRVHYIHSAIDRLLHILGGDGLELKHRRSAENSVEHAEIGVLCCGGDERDAPVLNKL